MYLFFLLATNAESVNVREIVKCRLVVGAAG